MLLHMAIMMVLLGVVPSASHGLTLEQKAKLFQHDMEARFLIDGQALCKLKLPAPSRDFVSYNMPDNAYMTGIYVGTLAMKYAVTGAPEDLAAARQSLEALHLLCNVSGAPGVLARAAWPKDRSLEDDGIWRDSPDGIHIWRGDVSTDQVDGVMFGFALAYDLIADDAEKKKIAKDAKAIAEHIMANDIRIVDVDGKPTRWGRYDPTYTGFEKMNALLWLQVLKVVAHVSGEERYETLYREWALNKGYAEIALKARRDINPTSLMGVNHSDDVLLFLAYTPLLMYERDVQIRDLILESVRRSWEGERHPGVKPEGNPFYAFVMGNFLKDTSGVDDALNTLRWFPLSMKWNRETIKKYEIAFSFTYKDEIKSPEPAAGQPIPIDRRIKTWSAWVQDPYKSAGSRDAAIPMEFNGHDYLIGYWMGRYYKFITADETGSVNR